MNLKLDDKIFEIKYDVGNSKIDTKLVPHDVFTQNQLLQKLIIEQKCLKCGLVTKYRDLKLK